MALVSFRRTTSQKLWVVLQVVCQLADIKIRTPPRVRPMDKRERKLFHNDPVTAIRAFNVEGEPLNPMAQLAHESLSK